MSKVPLKYGSVQSSNSSSYKNGSSRYKSLWFRTIFRVFLIGVVLVAVIIGGVYIALSSSLPDLSEMDEVVFPEATTITDRDGNVLYRIFQQNRSYVQFEEISPNMVNAIISIEDQSFWTNEGVDWRGIVRAGVGVATLDPTAGGGSTITQQLLKNIILADEESKYVRKIKEWMLVGRLYNVIENEVKENNPGLNSDETQRRVKEEILELYLNYIFMGQNAYGVQAAAQTFFNKDIGNISALEGAILASLPQSPTRYNPYNNPVRVMGDLIIMDRDGVLIANDSVQAAAIERVDALINRIDLSNKQVSSIDKQLVAMMDFTLSVDGQQYNISYQLGRKDYVLMNMLQEGYIESPTFKQSFVDGLNYVFEGGDRINIKAPHFVWWVQDLVLEMFPEEGEQLLQRGGLRIQTTLDSNTQEWAEAALTENYRHIQGYGASNASMIYLDSTNGDVLGYVGSSDYFNEEIDGEVDMLRSLRQPGSSIKPFVYALGIERLGLTLDTPLFDVPLTVGGNSPNNADGRFNGYMPLREALAYSRNIAPIKLFLAMGGEDILKPFLQRLGLVNLSAAVNYGYPLAIGAGEVTTIELANAYAHLSRTSRPAVIDPLMQVTTSDGTVLYRKTYDNVPTQLQVITEGAASMVNTILSTRANMPAGWMSTFSIPGLNYAIKSGTSDMKIQVNGREELRPRDGWLAMYTPDRVAIFWSGNADGSAMNANAFGGRLNAPAWKAFISQVRSDGLIENQLFPRRGMVSLTIDKYSGLLPADDTPLEHQIETMAYADKRPRLTATSRQSIEYDTSCNGQISPLTPLFEVSRGYIADPVTSFMPDQRDVPQIREWFSTQTGFFLSIPEERCDGRQGESDDNIIIDIIKPLENAIVTQNFDIWYNISNTRLLERVRIYLNDVSVYENNIRGRTDSLSDIASINAYQGLEVGDYVLMIEVVDVEGFVNRKSIPITMVDTDTQPPYLQDTRVRIEVLDDGMYEIYLLFADDSSPVTSVSVLSGGVALDSSMLDGGIVRFTIPSLGFIDYVASDSFDNIGSGSLDLLQYSGS